MKIHTHTHTHTRIQRERESVCVCVCACMCVKERKSETEGKTGERCKIEVANARGWESASERGSYLHLIWWTHRSPGLLLWFLRSFFSSKKNDLSFIKDGASVRMNTEHTDSQPANQTRTKGVWERKRERERRWYHMCDNIWWSCTGSMDSKKRVCVCVWEWALFAEGRNLLVKEVQHGESTLSRLQLVDSKMLTGWDTTLQMKAEQRFSWCWRNNSVQQIRYPQTAEKNDKLWIFFTKQIFIKEREGKGRGRG